MTLKGKTNAKTAKVADAETVSKPGAGNVEHHAPTPPSTSRIRREKVQGKRTPGQHGDRSNDVVVAGPRAEAAVQPVPRPHAGKRAKALTPESVDRLREAKRANRTIGELVDEYEAEQKADPEGHAWTHRDSWHHGRRHGFDQGVESERKRIADEDERPSRLLRIWQAISILMFGILLGMLIPR